MRNACCSRFCASAKPGVRVVMNGAERFTLLHRVANLLVQNETDGGIDHVFFLLAAPAQHQAGDT